MGIHRLDVRGGQHDPLVVIAVTDTQQTATFTETRRPVTIPTDLATPRSVPSAPPLPMGPDTCCSTRVVVVSSGSRRSWRHPGECGGTVAVRVLYVAVTMSW